MAARASTNQMRVSLRSSSSRVAASPIEVVPPTRLRRVSDGRDRASEASVAAGLARIWHANGGSFALDPLQPVRGRPPLDDEHRGLLVEVGVHDLGDIGMEAVAV